MSEDNSRELSRSHKIEKLDEYKNKLAYLFTIAAIISIFPFFTSICYWAITLVQYVICQIFNLEWFYPTYLWLRFIPAAIIAFYISFKLLKK